MNRYKSLAKLCILNSQELQVQEQNHAIDLIKKREKKQVQKQFKENFEINQQIIIEINKGYNQRERILSSFNVVISLLSILGLYSIYDVMQKSEKEKLKIKLSAHCYIKLSLHQLTQNGESSQNQQISTILQYLEQMKINNLKNIQFYITLINKIQFWYQRATVEQQNEFFKMMDLIVQEVEKNQIYIHHFKTQIVELGDKLLLNYQSAYSPDSSKLALFVYQHTTQLQSKLLALQVLKRQQSKEKLKGIKMIIMQHHQDNKINKEQKQLNDPTILENYQLFLSQYQRCLQDQIDRIENEIIKSF